jgi:hypothetical protein
MAQTRCASAEDSKGKKADKKQSAAQDAQDPSGVVDVVSLDESELRESSGLAISLLRPGHFWSHNDSGGTARLYAFDSQGRNTGQLKLNSAGMIDWEDMASFTDHGVPRLLIADCGDNESKRSSITLHLLDEPDPRDSKSRNSKQTMSIVYSDGPRDCEAVAVDAHRQQIVLISKTFLPAAGVYVVPLPTREETPTRAIAKRVATLPLPMVTAMDIDQSSGDIWVVSYFQGFRFRCADRDIPIARQIAALPQSHELPRWKQIESVAVDADHDVWVTSEGSPTPLGRLPQNITRQKN